MHTRWQFFNKISFGRFGIVARTWENARRGAIIVPIMFSFFVSPFSACVVLSFSCISLSLSVCYSLFSLCCLILLLCFSLFVPCLLSVFCYFLFISPFSFFAICHLFSDFLCPLSFFVFGASLGFFGFFLFLVFRSFTPHGLFLSFFLCLRF